MWMMFVTAIPCLGLLMVLIWAFTGENESRKSYFRAILVWFGILVALFLALALIGQLPLLQKLAEDLPRKR